MAGASFLLLHSEATFTDTFSYSMVSALREEEEKVVDEHSEDKVDAHQYETRPICPC